MSTSASNSACTASESCAKVARSVIATAMLTAHCSRVYGAMYTWSAEHGRTRTMPDSGQIARLLLAVVAGLLIAGIPLAQTPPVEFKGVPLGSSEAQWRTAFPFFRCEDSSDRILSDRACVFDRARRPHADGHSTGSARRPSPVTHFVLNRTVACRSDGCSNFHQQGENYPAQPEPAYEFDQRIAW
jgi:hypothetical protein